MTVFADSSALVKLYADEDGSETVRAEETFVVSHLARVEVPAAIWRKQRAEGLDHDGAEALIADFEADWYPDEATEPRFLPVRVTAEILDHAARLTARHFLRAYDAVQLASVLAARAVDEGIDTFACFDEDLRAAAQAEGFNLLGFD